MKKQQQQKIDISGIAPGNKLFHNVWINVYPTVIHINQIFFWPENARNLLDFEMLTNELDKKLDVIPEREIIKFLAKQPRLKLGDLKKSISQNGVRVPLIVLDDGTLLDGNRRYFACKLIQYEEEDKGRKLSKVLGEIPVDVIKSQDIDEKKKEKILAEANFVPDYKIEWTLDVKAKIIRDFYDERKNEGMEEDAIYEEILDVYSVVKKDVKDYIAAFTIVDEFINCKANRIDELKRRQIIQQKFVYFWEFNNKALRGRSPLTDEELPAVKELFFNMMLNDRFKNIKQIEPMARAIREEDSWQLLIESSGTKIDLVEAIYMENKATRSVDDKFRNFFKWLNKQESENLNKESLTGAVIRIIEDIIKKLQSIINP